MTEVLVGAFIGLILMWVTLAVALLVLRPPGESLRDLVKVFPNSLRLVAGLYRDRTLPGSVRWRLRIALIYNLQPINLIPDFIPVIGFADNAIVLIWALRATVRAAGAEAVRRHWSGSPHGLGIISRVVGIDLTEPRRADERS